MPTTLLCLWCSHHAYVGGYSGDLQASMADMWRLPLTTTEWEELPQGDVVPAPRAGHVAAMLNHRTMVSD
jgi:hypothetical protein